MFDIAPSVLLAKLRLREYEYLIEKRSKPSLIKLIRAKRTKGFRLGALIKSYKTSESSLTHFSVLAH